MCDAIEKSKQKIMVAPLGLNSSSRGGRKWLDSGYVLKQNLKGFANRCSVKKIIRNNSNFQISWGNVYFQVLLHVL